MIYKFGILGASGKMGLEVAGLIGPGLEEGNDTIELGDAVASSKKLTSIEGVPVRTLDEPAWEPVHGWIDFSRPAATMKLLGEAKAPIVVATTGFSEEQIGTIKKYAESQPVLLASNTSPGMNVMMRALKQLPASLKEGFELILEESHHKHKKDAPSGTAKSLLKILEEKGFPAPQVHVTRAGGLTGEHTMRFVGLEEEFVISHRAWDRKVFARGAIKALLFLLKKKTPGLYTMDDIYT